MQNLYKFLKKIEKNFLNRNKTEKVDFRLNGEVYEVLLLNRREKKELVFSQSYGKKKTGEIYEILKPYIYKSFGLKDLALKALDEGYIQTHYEVIETLFSPDEIVEIIDFMIKANNLKSFYRED